MARMRITDAEQVIGQTFGARMKRRRLELGITQTAMADALGRSFQQIHKYELGHNKVPLYLLPRLCELLQVGHSYFLDEPCAPLSAEEKQAAREVGTLALVRNFRTLAPEAQKLVSELVRGLAAQEAAR